ncbi:MAG TPA: hypothetical protein ENJ35_04895 [Gammaproteobacteria bacterium]|nr:hypothetical protein [Gammaproteobacteria bacterium]
MNPQDLTGIHDILPLEKPPLISAGVWLALVVTIIISITGFLLWRHLRPLNRLQRDLHKGRITTRAAAHRLAHLSRLSHDSQREIDQLRFSRQPPNAKTLQALIEKIRNDR